MKDCSATDLTFWLTSSFFALDRGTLSGILSRKVYSCPAACGDFRWESEHESSGVGHFCLVGKSVRVGGITLSYSSRPSFPSFAQPVPQLLYRLPLVFSTPDVMLGVYS